MQLNYSLLTYPLLAVASTVPKMSSSPPLPLPLLGLSTLCEDILTRTSQNIDRRAVGDVLAVRASTKGSAAPAKASAALTKASVALQARASATGKSSATTKGSAAPAKASTSPAKASAAPAKNTVRAFPAGHWSLARM
jgi:hypothetical protein